MQRIDRVHTHYSSSFFLFFQRNKNKILLRFQKCRGQTAEPHGAAFLWHIRDRKKTRGYEFYLSFSCYKYYREFSPPSLTSPSLCSGKILCNIEQFGQYPLQVNGFNNLDECLEGAMVEKEIESLHSEHSITSGREVN